MPAYYNEIDPFAAAWLRELIKAGHIADGIVDERSIEDVEPDELLGYTQCHFFAGIGVWSYALRQSGWPDDRPVWTGSCPCQPFSAAGKGGGFDDERHLWPAFQWLIQQCQPSIIFGEQVASKAAGAWFDLVQADVEAMGYEFGCVPFPSAGVGAPHIRDRAYWVADANNNGQQARSERPEAARHRNSISSDGGACGVANTSSAGLEKREGVGRVQREEVCSQPGEAAFGCIDTNNTAPTNGFWGDVDWLGCRDGKFRPVEPGTFPLADGTSARVGRLRGYGNAINAEAAKAFIGAYLDIA